MHKLNAKQINAALHGLVTNTIPVMPKCLNCLDLGNYEIAVLSNGTEMVKWKYTESVLNIKGVSYPSYDIKDCVKSITETDPSITELHVYRKHCEKCHPTFVAKHERLAEVLKDKHSTESDKSDAKKMLSKMWGLSLNR